MDGISARKLYRPSVVAWIALGTHVFWLTVFVYVYVVGSSDGGRLPIEWCETCSHIGNSVRLANELGRLDWLGLALSILGVGLVIVSLAGFLVVRSAAMAAAREEANRVVKNDLSAMISPAMVATALEQNSMLLMNALASLRARTAEEDPTLSGETANTIAGSDLD